MFDIDVSTVFFSCHSSLVLGGDAEPRAVTARTLSRLFQPPVDIMFRGSLDAVSQVAVTFYALVVYLPLSLALVQWNVSCQDTVILSAVCNS